MAATEALAFDMYGTLVDPIRIWKQLEHYIPGDAQRIAALARRADEITFILNPHPDRGQISSLQCGLKAAARGADGVFFTPVDSPGVQRETVLALKNAFGDADYVVPVFSGKRGHPVLLRASCAAEVMTLPAGATARDLLQARRAATRFVEVPDSAILDDIDDAAAYERWRKRRTSAADGVHNDESSSAAGKGSSG